MSRPGAIHSTPDGLRSVSYGESQSSSDDLLADMTRRIMLVMVNRYGASWSDETNEQARRLATAAYAALLVWREGGSGS